MSKSNGMKESVSAPDDKGMHACGYLAHEAAPFMCVSLSGCDTDPCGGSPL